MNGWSARVTLLVLLIALVGGTAGSEEVAAGPKIVELPEIILVGVVQGAPDVSQLDIAAMWQRFGAGSQAIPGAVEGTAYELHVQTAAEPCMHFCLTGVRVSELGAIPDDMFVKVLPPGTYAVFTHRVVDGYRRLYDLVNAWLAGSKYEEARPYDFQVYDSRFTSMDDPESLQDVYIPVRPK